VDDRTLLRQIKAIFEDSHGRYGSPRVQRVLKHDGVHLGEKRVARLMRQARLRARAARVYRRVPGVQRFFDHVPNLRLGQAAPDRLDQIWVGDLTYLRVAGAWRYLAVVMDLYSRRVVGWAVGRLKSAQLTLNALQRAIDTRRPAAGLTFHSDRGVEYAAYSYRALLDAHGILASMNRPYRCQDNAHMESFFHSLKAELIHGREVHTDGELNAILAGYIERFYNVSRLHSSLGYHSPVEFEQTKCLQYSVHKIG
jgi:transposase InsO family protein